MREGRGRRRYLRLGEGCERYDRVREEGQHHLRAGGNTRNGPLRVATPLTLAPAIGPPRSRGWWSLPTNLCFKFHEKPVQPGHAFQLPLLLESERVFAVFLQQLPATCHGGLGGPESDNVFRRRTTSQKGDHLLRQSTVFDFMLQPVAFGETELEDLCKALALGFQFPCQRIRDFDGDLHQAKFSSVSLNGQLVAQRCTSV